MAEAGYISEEQRTGRMVSGGKITSLAAEFSLTDGKHFSIYINPKTGNTNTTEVLTVKLPGNDASVEMPFKTEQWSELLLTAISADDLLSTADVYWGCGEEATIQS